MASGDADAEALFPQVYEQLRAIAAKRMAGERRDHTLQPTALVHEAYLKLAESTPLTWRNRGHFYATAEGVLRECVAIREEAMPDSWLRWNAVSLLGQSLADQGLYEKAEPLLLESYERMNPPTSNASRKEQARARLVDLYVAWDQPGKADAWRAPPAD